MEQTTPKAPAVPPQVLPFAVFMSFIALEQGVGLLQDRGMIGAAPQLAAALYPAKALVTAGLVLALRRHFPELNLRDLGRLAPTVLSVALGLLVFLLWINMTGDFATIGTPAGYDPYRFGSGAWPPLLIACRLFGAVLVVPVVEELFWRSFLLRYLVDPEYRRVPLGAFSWVSFLVTVLLFGVEHNLYLAGMMAGAAYNLLLYRTRSLAHCVLSHAVTNLALGIFVLATGKWQFW